MWLFSRVFIMLEIQSVFRISFGDRFGENIKYLIHRRWFGVDSVIVFGESKEKSHRGVRWLPNQIDR